MTFQLLSAAVLVLIAGGVNVRAGNCDAPIQLSTASSILAVLTKLDTKTSAMEKTLIATKAESNANTNAISATDNTVATLDDKVLAIMMDRLCGNGVMELTEQCDDGNQIKGDGCDDTCKIQTGYECHASGTNLPSVCTTEKCEKLKCGKNAYCEVHEDKPNAFKCSCLPGFTGHATSGCTDIDECAGTSPCLAGQEGSTCVNTPGSYSCQFNYVGNGWLQPTTVGSTKTTACTGGKCDNGHGLHNEGGSYGRWTVKAKPGGVPEIPGNVRPANGWMIEFDNYDKGYKEYEVHQRSSAPFNHLDRGEKFNLCAWTYNLDSSTSNGIWHSRFWHNAGVQGTTGIGSLGANKKWTYKCYPFNVAASKSRYLTTFSWYIGWPSRYGCSGGKKSCKVYVTGVQLLGASRPVQIEYIDNGWLTHQHLETTGSGSKYEGRTRSCTSARAEPFNCDNQHGISNPSGSYGRWKVDEMPTLANRDTTLGYDSGIANFPAAMKKEYPAGGQIIKFFADGAAKEYEVHAKNGAQWADPSNKNAFKDGAHYTMCAWVFNYDIKVTGNCGIQHMAFNYKGRRIGSTGIGALPASGAGWVKKCFSYTLTTKADSFNWYIGWPFNGCRCSDNSVSNDKCFAAVTGVSLKGPPKAR